MMPLRWHRTDATGYQSSVRIALPAGPVEPQTRLGHYGPQIIWASVERTIRCGWMCRNGRGFQICPLVLM
jgi:hypothetical protein